MKETKKIKLLKKYGIDFNAPLDRCKVRRRLRGIHLKGDMKLISAIDPSKPLITCSKPHNKITNFYLDGKSMNTKIGIYDKTFGNKWAVN